MIQAVATVGQTPEWVIGGLFVLEVIAGFFLERKRKRLSNPGEISTHLQCTEHSCLLEKLEKIDKKLDNKEITDRLDNISDLLVGLKGPQI